MLVLGITVLILLVGRLYYRHTMRKIHEDYARDMRKINEDHERNMSKANEEHEQTMRSIDAAFGKRGRR